MQSITPSPTQVNSLPANPLALKDIHLPEQITNYPVAYGWWILAALLLLSIVIIVIKVKKISKRNLIKKQALAQIKNNQNINNNELISLLKCTAMHYFSRIEIAKLYGESLQQFLLKQLSEKHQIDFTKLTEQGFKNLYKSDINNKIDNNFQQAARLWLTHALPPTNKKKIQHVTTEKKSYKEQQGVSE